jgi:hypothetical protein
MTLSLRQQHPHGQCLILEAGVQPIPMPVALRGCAIKETSSSKLAPPQSRTLLSCITYMATHCSQLSYVLLAEWICLPSTLWSSHGAAQTRLNPAAGGVHWPGWRCGRRRRSRSCSSAAAARTGSWSCCTQPPDREAGREGARQRQGRVCEAVVTRELCISRAARGGCGKGSRRLPVSRTELRSMALRSAGGKGAASQP